MDLWIRSQDKKQLLKVNDGLYIANGFSDTEDTFVGLKKVGHVGRYSTEKRALEVLDEIQDLFIKQEPKIILKKDGLKVENKQINSIVYEMPKE